MTPDQIKKLIDCALNYGLKFINPTTRKILIDTIDSFLPDVLAKLVGNYTPTQMVNNALDAIGLLLATHSALATIFNLIVKPLVLNNLPKILVMFESDVTVYNASPESLTLYQFGE
jgi:hypothetical protein